MTYKLNTNRNPIPDPEYGSNMHAEGSRTSVNTTLKGTKIVTCSWPDVQQQGFVSSYGMDPSTNHRGVGYSVTFMTLLHPWAYLAIPVIMVAHRAHSCVGDCHLLLYSNSMHSTFWHHASWSVPSGFPHILWPQCVVSWQPRPAPLFAFTIALDESSKQ